MLLKKCNIYIRKRSFLLFIDPITNDLLNNKSKIICLKKNGIVILKTTYENFLNRETSCLMELSFCIPEDQDL